ncbi:uncharacterized protein DUF4129 [Asanoa ferruginea]|uniref:Uncharacterized protein DUF4129 n=1 Tax=Asanoa ferruginea TaxID=53367 RepID=A0A3D9ZCB2_9ACTN|nr:DUF4129 domain-containing protein [Asanoa ferruginea]REF95046.1 uncharacterized protein DUF4129 [Asanoa ferruginea]GIF48860.1 hypothetical protein Afe04nite_33990 [Asanoa ferruginea]
MTGFARWWTEAVAAIGDHLALHWVVLILLLLAATVAVLWSNWARLRRVRWRWPGFSLSWRRRKPVAKPAEPDDQEVDALEPDALPDLPAATFVSRADRFAAEGRWAEAVRERLRAVVRQLVDRRVIEHHPGWTVTELASAAGRSAPATDRPLGAAGTIFSDIWYGEKPATSDDDAEMKQLASDVDQAVTGARVPASRRAEP